MQIVVNIEDWVPKLADNIEMSYLEVRILQRNDDWKVWTELLVEYSEFTADLTSVNSLFERNFLQFRELLG